MMVEIVASTGLAVDLIERTSRTADTLRAVELSLAPAFLLVGIGSIMNVMMARLTWVAGRIERLSDLEEEKSTPNRLRELEWLCRRRQFARRAILFSTAAASVISIVIAALFVSVYIQTRIGTLVAVLWVLTMGLLIAGLSQFFMETRIAAGGSERFRGRPEAGGKPND
ncbi:MAG: DUF2721 domain-containing protein [Erythrobacter sp.]|jgi:hypothetical protein|nr:DUF2721 domain-containing protein [Erythrobacter sp.]